MNKAIQRNGAAMAALLTAGMAQAQDVGVPAQRLPEIIAEGDRAPEPYRPGEGVEAGTSRIERGQVEAATPGSGDVNQLLKALPTVQFARDDGIARREDIQDIRPADISIAGGRFYENLLTVDGIDVSSRLDISGDNPFAINEVAGASAQGLWVDSNLVGSITLRDSNVPAEFGRFTGGALDIETRAPSRRWGASATINYTSDELTRFKVSDASREGLGENFPDRPNFHKWRYGATLDAPVTGDIQALFGYNHSRADVDYFRGVNYGGTRFGQSSVSDNYLGKLAFDLGGGLNLSAQATYSPYRSEASSANGADNMIVSHGGGLSTRVALDKQGAVDWNLTASYTMADNDRQAPALFYSIPSIYPNGAVCTATNCSIGGFGDLEQRQDSYALKGRVSAPLSFGTVSAGIDYQHVELWRRRAKDSASFNTPTTGNGSNIVCSAGDSLTCVTGQYALTQQLVYRAFEANVALDSVGGWVEALAELGDFALRAGLRYDHETYLSNHDVAPRVSLSYALPWDGWSLTVGANRYYGRSLLGYALREALPDNVTLRRTARMVGGQRIFADDWSLFSVRSVTTYSGDGSLKTPYSDELTAALSSRVLGGSLQLRGIYREGRNDFTRAPATTETKILENGQAATFTQYILSNDGFSSYRGASLEYVRSFGKHSVAINLNWSGTKSSNATIFDDLEDFTDGTLVVFAGEVVTLDEVERQNQRPDFASPLLGNIGITSLWFGDRLTTNVNLRYRHAFQRIEDSGVNERIDGILYDVYDFVDYPGLLDVNLNARGDIVRSRYGTLTAEVRVANLLDNTPAPNSRNLSQPYQFGRSFWTGLAFRF